MVSMTVVTVVRDDSTGFRATMASVAAQVAQPDQVLVVDSTADRAAIGGVGSDFPSVTIEYAWREPSGVYGAMNESLALVTSDYVYFLNAGDEFASSLVVAGVRAALTEHEPLWAVGRVEFRTEQGTRLTEPAWSYADERRHLFARGRFPAHQGVVVRTDALRGLGGFDRSYTVAADYAAILRLSTRADPLELDLVLAEFTTGGLSSQRWRASLTEFHRARIEAFQPSGVAAVAERLWTMRTRATTEAYRALWAPGRPLAAIVARGRANPPG